MIPRYQRLMFYCLLAGIVTMASFLFRERQIVRDRWNARIDATPLPAPGMAAATAVTLNLANDSDGTVTPVECQVALPQETSMRARALLDRLTSVYSLPRSAHPLPEGEAVDDVFLLQWPPMSEARERTELAVINLRSSFIDQHPSGAQTEMLSLLSMVGTFHANFPEVAQIRFVVDGKSRETIAGHVDLDRMFPAIDTTISASDRQPAP